jgi:hypothetical protein
MEVFTTEYDGAVFSEKGARRRPFPSLRKASAVNYRPLRSFFFFLSSSSSPLGARGPRT